jgi:hypothetical protein
MLIGSIRKRKTVIGPSDIWSSAFISRAPLLAMGGGEICYRTDHMCANCLS